MMKCQYLMIFDDFKKIFKASDYTDAIDYGLELAKEKNTILREIFAEDEDEEGLFNFHTAVYVDDPTRYWNHKVKLYELVYIDKESNKEISLRFKEYSVLSTTMDELLNNGNVVKLLRVIES